MVLFLLLLRLVFLQKMNQIKINFLKVIYAIGWVPHESQQQSKCRGTATVSLKDI